MIVDPRFQYDLTRAPRDPWALQQLFSDEEISRLNDSRCGIVPTRRKIVYLVYENHYAQGGGIFAVARHLPPWLAKTNHQVVVLSPFHSCLDRAPERPGTEVGTVLVPFAGSDVPATVFRYQREGITWILFGAEGFFSATGGSPYNRSNDELLRDGLFASAAVPHVLAMQGIDLTEDVVVHVQDWQLAATALTVKQAVLGGQLKTAAVVLTSHNPYDCALGREELSGITDRTEDVQWARPVAAGTAQTPRRRATVYECMMPLMDAPLSTVSRQYARDLTQHPLQAVHFADHLQEVLKRQGLVGVDNGLFMEPRRPFSESSLLRAADGDFSAVLDEKLAKRRRMLQALTRFDTPHRFGYLRFDASWDLTRLPNGVPVFMMFGRMDPGQKGFDVLAHAIRRMPPNAAKFVICPIVPAGVDAFLDHWRDVAHSRPGDVIVYTGRLGPYLQVMAGATYCVMPSLHEPFGAATEPYLMGTPVVAHATGGLIQQVIDYHQSPAQATGLLFRHAFAASSSERGAQWRQIMLQLDPLARMHSALYVSLVNGLATALQQASDLYRNRPADYGRMLSRLYDQATRFTWEKAAAEYGAIYDMAARP